MVIAQLEKRIQLRVELVDESVLRHAADEVRTAPVVAAGASIVHLISSTTAANMSNGKEPLEVAAEDAPDRACVLFCFGGVMGEELVEAAAVHVLEEAELPVVVSWPACTKKNAMLSSCFVGSREGEVVRERRAGKMKRKETTDKGGYKPRQEQ